MRTFPVVLVASLLVSLSAGSARAVMTTEYPQAADWAGFVDELGDSLLDEVATGGLAFAFFGDDARGYVRFPLTSIPPGSIINSVTYRPWTCNHDLITATLCQPIGPKTATVSRCTEDPLTSTVPLMWAAIGAGPSYATWVIPRSGPLWCLDYYVQNVVPFGAVGIADVQAALPAGFITLGLRTDTPCDPTSDHIDWLGYSEVLVGGDPGCVLTTLPGSRMALDIDYTPGTMAVKFESFDAIASLAGSGSVVDVRFVTLEELDTNYFAVERAEAETGPFAPTGDLLDARGPGFRYRQVDANGHAGQWYRIVEYTSNGRGDVSPAFVAHSEGPLPRGTETSGGMGQRVRGR